MLSTLGTQHNSHINSNCVYFQEFGRSHFISMWNIARSDWYLIRIFNYEDKILVSGASACLSNQEMMFEHTAKWSIIKGIYLIEVFRKPSCFKTHTNSIC